MSLIYIYASQEPTPKDVPGRAAQSSKYSSQQQNVMGTYFKEYTPVPYVLSIVWWCRDGSYGLSNCSPHDFSCKGVLKKMVLLPLKRLKGDCV